MRVQGPTGRWLALMAVAAMAMGCSAGTAEAPSDRPSVAPEPYLGLVEDFLHGDLGYTLVWACPAGNEAADKATFERIVDSVKFWE